MTKHGIKETPQIIFCVCKETQLAKHFLFCKGNMTAQ